MFQASQYYTMLQKIKPKLLTQDQFCCGFAMKGKLAIYMQIYVYIYIFIYVF